MLFFSKAFCFSSDFFLNAEMTSSNFYILIYLASTLFSTNVIELFSPMIENRFWNNYVSGRLFT